MPFRRPNHVQIPRRIGRAGRFVAGWTLAEAIVSLGVLGLGISGILVINSRVLGQTRSTRQTAAATHALQERIDAVRHASWTQVSDTAYLSGTLLATASTAGEKLPGLIEQVNVVTYPPTGAAANSVCRNADGSRTILSTNATMDTDAEAVSVLVRLTWSGANGTTRTRENMTVLAKGGIAK